MTAPELIASRADRSKPYMGLTSWKGDTLRKTDVTVAKNYLSQEEIGELNRIVTMWLDYAEDQARRRKQVFLKDWETKLNEFLRFNSRDGGNDAERGIAARGWVRVHARSRCRKDQRTRFATKFANGAISRSMLARSSAAR